MRNSAVLLVLHAALISNVCSSPVIPSDSASTPIVRLSYGSFQGSTTGNTTSFLGIPYAQPPVGRLRFAPPQPPAVFRDIRDATSFGNMCPQQNSTLPAGIGGILQNAVNLSASPLMSEDCLFVNVIRPTNIPPGKKLPVAFWIYGGSFETGDTSFNPGFPVVERSIALGEPIIYVSANYRLNAFGFLPGKEVKAAGLGNVGLRDQRFAMTWVQDFISQFGGDASRVTIWGESAGAFSVGLHLVLNDGNPQGLFRAAIMESGSPVPTPDITENQQFYDQLVVDTGCSGSKDTLQCLRDVPFETLLGAVNKSPNIFAFRSLELAWRPLVDGTFLRRNPAISIQQGQFAKVPLITGDCDDEGTVFSLSTLNITTDDEFLQYINQIYFPTLSAEKIAPVATAYPQDPTQGSPFGTGTQNAITPQFKRLAAFQGDLVFQAPRRFFLRAASKTQTAWAFLFKRGKSTPVIGTFHGSDLAEFYSSSGSPDFVGTDILVNFVNNLNPNAPRQLPVQSFLSNITWDQWGSSSRAPPLLTFVDPAPALTISPDTFRVDAMNLLTALILQAVN